MADASFVQPAFLGGEWSPNAQGRYDLPKYRMAMSISLNGLPTVEGAWERRSGTKFLATTRNGFPGRVVSFDFTDSSPYTIELSANHLRMLTGSSLVFTNDTTVVNSFSADDPSIVTLADTVDWATGDEVQFLFSGSVLSSTLGPLRNRQFVITVLNSTQFTIADPISNEPIDGSAINWVAGSTTVTAARILDFDTPWAGPNLDEWQTVRVVQAAGYGVNDSTVGVMLQGAHQPQLLSAIANPSGNIFAQFTFGAATFADGPYFDPPAGATLQPSASGSGQINLTIGYQIWSSTVAYSFNEFVSSSGVVYQSLIEGNLGNTPGSSPTTWVAVSNGAAVGINGFQSTDVGRLIRVFSEPQPWLITTTYSMNDVVAYNGAYYQAADGNTGKQPDVSVTDWLPVSGALYAAWTWAQIVAIVSTNEVTVNILGSPLLYSFTINTWQIGVYSDTTGWPTCGLFYEGRLWLSGAIANRIDSSNSDDIFNFAPTGPDGTVADNNGISEVFNSSDLNTIYWMEPIGNGQFVCGTKNGEWLIQASTLSDPLTPSSTQSHRVSKYGCANILPAHTPLTIAFVQKYDREIFEYFSDVFSGKLVAPSMNTLAKHLTVAGVEEVAYQAELTPVVWARTGSSVAGNGLLIGCTYRRTSAFSNSEADFIGWHHHVLGSGNSVASIAVGPSPDETLDTLTMTTEVHPTGVFHVEQLTPLFDNTAVFTGFSPMISAWFVDDACTPSGSISTEINGVPGVLFYGYFYLAGLQVSAMVGGLDCGDFQVAADGTVFVPYGSDAEGAFTFQYMQQLSAAGINFGQFATNLDVTTSIIPPDLPTNGTVGAFVPNVTTVPAYSTVTQPIVDWANQRMFVQGFNDSSGIHKFSLTTFKDEAQVAISGPLSLGGDGFLYVINGVVGGSGVLNKLDPNELNTVAVMGTGSSGVDFSSNAVPVPFGRPAGTSSVDGNGYLVVSSTFGEVGAYNTTQMGFGGFVLDTLRSQSVWVPGSSATVLGLDAPTGLGNPSIQLYSITFGAGSDGYVYPAPFVAGNTYNQGTNVSFRIGVAVTQVYNCIISVVSATDPQLDTEHWAHVSAPTNPGITSSVLGTINATDVDPNWTDITGVSGFTYDLSDGNLLVQLSNAFAPPGVPRNYLTKISSANASILWKTPSIGPAQLFGGTSSRPAGNVFGWMIGNVATVLNTQDGSVQNFTIPGLFNSSQGQAFDAISGQMVTGSSFSETTGGPTPDAGSPTNWTGLFAEFQYGTRFFGAAASSARFSIPAVIGFTYTSQGQVLRPIIAEDSGSRNGPSVGKTQRLHMFSTMLAGTQGISFGTDFEHQFPAQFQQPNGAVFSNSTLFNGVYWDTIDSDYSFNEQGCWQITRPYPATVVTFGGFLHTQDR